MQSRASFVSYDAALKHYIAFLKGNCDSPTHEGPVEHETNCILDSLIKINQMGFLTLDSQPATYKRRGKFRTRQREYIYGIAPLNICEKLKHLDPQFQVHTIRLPIDSEYIANTGPSFLEEEKVNGVWIPEESECSQFYLSDMANSDFGTLFGNISSLYAIVIVDTLLSSSSNDSRKGLLSGHIANLLA